MRLWFVFFAFLLLLGCAPAELESFNVAISSEGNTDAKLDDDDHIREEIFFRMTNKEEFSLDCYVEVLLSNITNTTIEQARVGVLEPEQPKRVSLRMEMFGGQTEVKIRPLCRRT